MDTEEYQLIYGNDNISRRAPRVMDFEEAPSKKNPMRSRTKIEYNPQAKKKYVEEAFSKKKAKAKQKKAQDAEAKKVAKREKRKRARDNLAQLKEKYAI